MLHCTCTNCAFQHGLVHALPGQTSQVPFCTDVRSWTNNHVETKLISCLDELPTKHTKTFHEHYFSLCIFLAPGQYHFDDKWAYTKTHHRKKLWKGQAPPILAFSLSSSKSRFSQPFKKRCISEVGRIGSIIIFQLSKLCKAEFFILCDVIFLVRLQEKFEVVHSWEWKG